METDQIIVTVVFVLAGLFLVRKFSRVFRAQCRGVGCKSCGCKPADGKAENLKAGSSTEV